MAKTMTLKLGGAKEYNGSSIFQGYLDIVSLRSMLLFGLRGMAAYAWHARVLGKENTEVNTWLYKGLRSIGVEHTGNEWLALPDGIRASQSEMHGVAGRSYTSNYGQPVPT